MSTGATALKAYFVAGAEPTAVQFAELIDGNLNLNDGGTVKGPVYNSRIVPSLAGMTATATATAGTITAVANVIAINPFTGAAAQLVTLPAATVGIRVAYIMSVDTTGGTEILTFDSAGSDAFRTGTIVESRATNAVVYDTSTAGEAKVVFTPANQADDNYVSLGSVWMFWCSEAGLWDMNLDAKQSPLGDGLVGATAFGA